MMTDRGIGEITAAVLFAPDAWDQGLIHETVTHVEKLGLRAVAAIPRSMSRADAISLYAGYTSFTAAEGRTHAQWLMPDLYSAGISLLVLFAGSSEDALIRLKKAKGRSTRTLREHGSLRSLSQMTDRCFGLFHAPDTISEMRQMIAIITGPEALPALEKYRSMPRIRDKQLNDLTRRERLDPRAHQPEIVLQLLLQGIARISLDPILSEFVGDIRAFSEAVEAIEATWHLAPTEPLLWHQLAQIPLLTVKDVHGDQCHIYSWRTNAMMALAHSLTCALRELCVEQNYEPQLAMYVKDVFHYASLPLGGWSEHRLNILMSFSRETQKERFG